MSIRSNGAQYARAVKSAIERPLSSVARIFRSGEAEDSYADVVCLDGGRAAFDEIINNIQTAERTIEMRTFLWRDDEIGNRVAAALLGAADRGVEISIQKDRIAAVYEVIAGTQQSFFHKDMDPVYRFQAWFLSTVYNGRGAPRQQRNPLAEAILAHPNIKVRHSTKRFDHSKLFIFDDRRMVLGSMGIADAHHQEWVEMAVRVEGEQHVRRLHERVAGEVPFDPHRRLDFLTHCRDTHPVRTCPMLGHRLALMASAEKSLVIAMAYLGDKRFTNTLIQAVRRGVDVTLVTAGRADVLGDLGRATCDKILRKTGAPDNLAIVLMPRMVHAKVVVRDRRWSDIGSANFTRLSHGVYNEINLHVDNEAFARSVELAIDHACAEGELASRRVKYRKLYVQVERAICAYQGRNGG